MSADERKVELDPPSRHNQPHRFSPAHPPTPMPAPGLSEPAAPAQQPVRVPASTAVGSPEVLETARHARRMHQIYFEGTDANVVRVPEGAITELIRGIADIVRGEICQIVPLSALRPADSFSHRIWRNLAAQGGTQVSRLYVVPPGDTPRALLEAQMEADQASAVVSAGVAVGGTRSTEESRPPDVPMNEVWLIGDGAVIKQESTALGALVWVVSTRPDDVAEARSLWARLWGQQAKLVRDASLFDLTDPLLESAEMIHTVAQMSCTHDHIDRISCEWYHGAWQYLRLFNMVSSPGWHLNFYRHWLRQEVGRTRHCRVLISGAADYSTLALVLDAANRPRDLDVHVLDLCRTPLIACQWYAKRFGTQIGLHDADILWPVERLVERLAADFRTDGIRSLPVVGTTPGDEGLLSVGDPASGDLDASGVDPDLDAADPPRLDHRFDLIVADAFLTRFTPDEAATVLSNWYELLRPGGAVVTTVRLHPRNDRRRGTSGALGLVRSGADRQLLDFTLRLRQRAAGWQGMLRIGLDDLIEAARVYALRMTSRNLGDQPEIERLFTEHGFTVVHEETGRVDGELCPTEYLRVVARKKAD